jgi:hypothetical protein
MSRAPFWLSFGQREREMMAAQMMPRIPVVLGR